MPDVSQSEEKLIDAMGKPCPMPLLMLKRSLKKAGRQRIVLKSSDPHSQQDISRYCQIHNLHCEISIISDAEFHYLIES